MSLTTTATTLSPTTASVTTTISAGRPPQAQSSSFSSTTKTLPRSLRKRLPTPFTNTSSTSSSSTRAGRGLASSLSTPNLSSLFAAHARRAPGVQGVPPLPSLPHQPSVPLPLPLLTRKASLAALTSSSLATIPDATESYAFDTLNELAFPSNSDNSYNSNSNSNNNAPPATMAPLTPGRFASSMASYSGAPTSDEPVVAGDAVDVPGGMHGTVRFVGSVAGRKGVFAGVELHPDFATRGKNSGDVDGVSYFSTNIPGAGIFLPLNKAIRRDASPSAFPMTPTATNGTGLKLGNQNSINFTPPTPSLPKFSQSVSGGPLPRAPSPQHGTRRPPRTSLPRPDSPVRRLQMTPAPGSNGPRPSLPAATPAAKGGASSGAGGAPGRFGSPTSTSKFSQSMRAPGTAGMGDPSKRGTGLGMLRGGPVDRKASIGPRSASALGSASNYGDDDNATPTNAGRVGRSNGSAGGSANGSVGSASSFSGQAQQRGIGRPPSRTASHMKNGSIATATTLANSSGNNDEEVERLRSELQDRDRQLKDQASTLADMESSLTELQGLIESSDVPLGPNPNGGGPGATPGGGADGFDGDDKDMAQLRALLREKNDKIAMLTAEFDTHRADFRSTIDTLEMASTETERVYEKKIEEMMQENQELESRLADVEAVAQQLKQLEELVQELEEGLEDARRGEAEARGEVEFLRGEVERTRTELRREREKAAMLVASGGGGRPGSGGVGVGPGTLVRGNSTSSNPSKDLEQKDDEIRGLKAIIHSLSQNAGVSDGSNNASNGGGSSHRRGESINERLAREALEREVADLRTLLDNKSTRETEMEREIEQLRLTGNGAAASSTNNLGAHRSSAMTVGSRSSLRDSRGTVVLARDFRESLNGGGLSSSGNNNSNGGSNNLSAHHNHSRSNSNPRTGNRSPDQVRKLPHHSRGPTLDTMPESDAYSSVTESSTLWCEICETNGHDILTCTNMFGSAAGAGAGAGAGANGAPPPASSDAPAQLDSRTGKDVVRAAFSSEAVAPMIPLKLGSVAAKTAPPPEVKILPNPMESGPVAGKESGVVDAGKWCALCERDGHDSVDCPFEDAF